MAVESSYMTAPGETQTAFDARRKLALMLAQKSMEPQKIEHWTQGLAQLANAGISGWELHNLDKQDREETARGNELLVNQAYGQQAATQPAPVNPTQSPMGSAAGNALAASPDASMPRGFRNSNPGNIEDGPFARSQPGYVGSDGRFAKFASMEHGTGAMNALLDSYEKRGVNTIDGVINRWAPSSDGNNTQAYVQNVARQAGLDPSAPITPDKRQAIIAAMAQHENGKPLPQTVPQALSQPAPVSAATQQAVQPYSREQMIQLLGNRKTAAIAQGILKAQIESRIKPETTDEIKEYNLYSRQEAAAGRKPLSFFEYKSGIKKAGAQNISIDQKPELAFDTKAGQLQAERYDKIVQGGHEAKSMISDIETLRELGARIGTGKGAEVLAALGPYAESIGIKIDGLGEMQAFNAVVARMAPRMRVEGSGATSDFDARQYLSSLQALGKTPEGNEIISRTNEAIAQHKIAASEIAGRALNKEISRSEADKLLRALPDPMALWKQNKGKFLSDKGAVTVKQPAAERPAPPASGAVKDGWKFKGGDPSKKENWEQVL